MSINVPVRPNAALNDPETRHLVETEINSASSSGRDDQLGRWGSDPDGIVNILSNYPWREYTFKRGRWARVRMHDPVIPIRWWEKIYHGMMLTDPATGQEIAEIDGLTLQSQLTPSGQALFAGDPHYAGVISVVVNGKRKLCIAGSARLTRSRYVDPLSFGDGYKDILEKASELAKVMVPERRPEVQLYDPPAKYLRLLGPWLADHPKKPPGFGLPWQ